MTIETYPNLRMMVETLPDGGFVVSKMRYTAMACDQPILACTHLDEALDFIRKKFKEATK